MRRSNRFAATALSAIRRALARLTDAHVHAARIFEYYDYGARSPDRMLEELRTEFGYPTTNDLILAHHHEIFNADIMRNIEDWLRHYKAYFYYNPLTYLTDEKIDDELDGRDLEEVVKRIYYECFPNLSPQQVRTRVSDYYHSCEERRQNDINSLNEQNRLDDAVEVAKLCLEYYHFDMERRKKEMSEKLKEKLRDNNNIVITKGACTELLQNLYDNKEDILQGIALKTRDQDYINNTTISNKVTQFSGFGPQQQVDPKEVKRLVLESLWFEFGHFYRIDEVQKLINDYYAKFYMFSAEEGENNLNEHFGLDFDSSGLNWN